MRALKTEGNLFLSSHMIEVIKAKIGAIYGNDIHHMYEAIVGHRQVCRSKIMIIAPWGHQGSMESIISS